MSARVFKPIYNDYSLMRTAITQDRAPSIRNVGKVKRVLFGEPIDHEETRKFLQQELAKQSSIDNSKWEFDFAKGKPLSPDGTDRRFEWSPVADTKTAACFAPKRRRNEVEEDISDLYCDATNIIKPAPRRPDQSTSTDDSESPIGNKQQQSRITDFMAVRKRTSDSAFAKKPVADPRPSKIARSNNVAS